MSDTTKSWPDGFLIMPAPDPLPAGLVDAFRGVPTAHASDCLGRIMGARGLVAFHGRGPLCGPAITVRTRPGDNLMIHKALMMARSGEVIVVDAGGEMAQAVVGGLMRTAALARGLGGFVIDGAIRDVAEFADGGFACYARGVIHRGPSKEGPGHINVPIACAGMAVRPGDLMLGDSDGVIAIPREMIEPLLPKVRAHAEREDRIRAASLEGTASSDRFDAILLAKGVPASLLKV